MNLFRRRKPDPVEREAERHGLSLVTTMRGEAGVRGSILIRDLSTSGFRAESMVKFRPGTKVVLDLPGWENIEAKVEWARREMIGVSFAKPVAVAGLLTAIGV